MYTVSVLKLFFVEILNFCTNILLKTGAIINQLIINQALKY